MKRALLVLCLVSAVGAPALGQESVSELVNRVHASDKDLDRGAAAAVELWKRLGGAPLPGNPQGLAGLMAVVRAADRASEPDLKRVGRDAAWALCSLGLRARPALPLLLDVARNPENLEYGLETRTALDQTLSDAAGSGADVIGEELRKRGELVWWAVPYTYRYEGLFLLVLVLAWFIGAQSQRRRYPSHFFARLVFLAVVAGIPAFLTGAAVHHACTQDWVEPFLPEPLTVVSLPTSVVLTVVFCCGLAAVWASSVGAAPQSPPLQPVPLHEPVEGGAGDP